MVVVHFAGGLARFTTGLEHGNKDSTSKSSTGFLTRRCSSVMSTMGLKPQRISCRMDGSTGFSFALHPAIL